MSGLGRSATLIFLAGLMAGIGPALAQGGRAEPAAACPDLALVKFGQAKEYLISIQDVLADDFAINARREGQERRTERQIMRRIENLRFKCKPDSECETSTAYHTITGGNAVRFCWDEMLEWSFCRMVDTVAHEFGHIAHLPRDRLGLHNARGESDPDRVYQFGHFAGELCLQDRDPTAQVNDPNPPARRVTVQQRSGIVLFPHPEYGGRWRQFLPGSEDEVSLRSYPAWADLRFIGRDNAFSSARVYSDVWELCDRPNGSGRCFYLDRSTPDFGALGFDNRISSVVRLTRSWPPSEGIFLFADMDYLGGGKHFGPGEPLDLANHDLAGEVSSYRVVDGVWEGCEGVLQRGWCHSLTGEKRDLSQYGLDDRIHSIAPTLPRRDGLLLYSEKRFRGGHKFLRGDMGSLNLGAKTPNVDDQARSLIAIDGEWEVCSEPGMRGRCERVSAAVADLEEIGLDRAISSARKVGESAAGVELYQRVGYSGTPLLLTNARANLRGTPQADSVSSLKVLDGRTWLACDFPNFQGWCYRFKGWHADLRTPGLRFDNRITSLRPLTDSEVAQRGLILFEDPGRAGASRHFTESVPHLGRLGIDNQASSAWVLDGTWELCRNRGFEGCTRISAVEDDLADLGLDDSVSSVRRID